jgi:hypothetical protein
VATYLGNERRLGRISDRVSPEHLTRILLGACFSQALLESFIGDDARVTSDEQFARDIVRALMDGADAQRPVPRSTETR